jgi:hypothetical protein
MFSPYLKKQWPFASLASIDLLRSIWKGFSPMVISPMDFFGRGIFDEICVKLYKFALKVSRGFINSFQE